MGLQIKDALEIVWGVIVYVPDHLWVATLYESGRIQNPDVPRAERFGAAQSGAAGRGGTGQDRTPTGRFA